MRTIIMVMAAGTLCLPPPSHRVLRAQTELEERANTKPANSLAGVRWPAPVLTDANLKKWLTFIRPTEEELRWRKVRWHTSLVSAAEEARKLQRPILLWTMNGNPCGET